jgi:hypothetical protein
MPRPRAKDDIHLALVHAAVGEHQDADDPQRHPEPETGGSSPGIPLRSVNDRAAER